MFQVVVSVVVVVSAAQPAHLPLLGEPGRRADGYPRQYVDRLALRAMLGEGRFEPLTAALTEAQDEFERDTTLEYWPSDAADSLGTADLELRPSLDAWCKAAPGSFAPWLARGTHHANRAALVRGTKWFKDTPPSAIKAMKREAALARADLERALQLRPDSIAAVRMLILVRRLLGEDPASLIKAALERCPDCFQVRVAIMSSLVPRWGGSYELMESFARASERSDNPRMKLLAGYVLLDKVDMGELGLEALNRAVALGEHWEFYAWSASKRADFDPRAARAALERAAELRPRHPQVVAAQVRVAAQTANWEEAALAWSLARKLDPSLAVLEEARPELARRLLPLARARVKEGSPRRALELFDVLAELSPADAAVRAERDALRKSLDAP